MIHYRVANGEALVEILGKPRPYDKVVFERHVLETTPFTSEERLDEEIHQGPHARSIKPASTATSSRGSAKDKGKDMVKTGKWTIEYKPVTEYIRRGTSTDPDAKALPTKEIGHLQEPKGDDFTIDRVVIGDGCLFCLGSGLTVRRDIRDLMGTVSLLSRSGWALGVAPALPAPQ